MPEQTNSVSLADMKGIAEIFDIREMDDEFIGTVADEGLKGLPKDEELSTITIAIALMCDKLSKTGLTRDEIAEAVNQFVFECALESCVRNGTVKRKGEWKNFKGGKYEVTSKGTNSTVKALEDFDIPMDDKPLSERLEG